MGNTDNSLARVVKQNRHTVRKAHEECQFRAVCQDNIGLTVGLTFRARRAGTNYIGAVHLPYIEDRIRLTIKRFKRQQAILSYPRQIIANCSANIERTPWVGADPTMPCKYSMAGSKGAKLIVA